MSDQVVILKHKTDGMIAIGIPVLVLIHLCGNPVYHQITAVIAVQTADDIQQGGLAGSAGSQDRYKLIVPQAEADTVQRFLHQFSCSILFCNIN